MTSNKRRQARRVIPAILALGLSVGSVAAQDFASPDLGYDAARADA